MEKQPVIAAPIGKDLLLDEKESKSEAEPRVSPDSLSDNQKLADAPWRNKESTSIPEVSHGVGVEGDRKREDVHEAKDPKAAYCNDQNAMILLPTVLEVDASLRQGDAEESAGEDDLNDLRDATHRGEEGKG